MAFGAVAALLLCPGAVLAAEPSADAIRIASFNIKVFGPKKARNTETLRILAAIVRSFDVVAVQEVKDSKGKVPVAFLNEINKVGKGYGMLLSERSGKQDDDRTFREQYAYYFRISTVAAVDEGVLYDDSGSDRFQREPFLARFRSKTGAFTFVLVTVHTQPAAAVSEIAALDEVVDWARKRYAGEDDFIVLGDFNAGCDYASEEELAALAIAGPKYDWLVPHSADTNLAPSQCAYDRIVTSLGTKEDYTGNWGVDRVFTDEAISDHLPVWAEFHVRNDTGGQF